MEIQKVEIGTIVLFGHDISALDDPKTYVPAHQYFKVAEQCPDGSTVIDCTHLNIKISGTEDDFLQVKK